KRMDLAPELWTIRIQAGGEFKFIPGQYATLGVQGVDKRLERPYSIVSSPYENEIEFFFELVPHGELTPEIYKLQVGDELLMRKVAKGRFTLDTKSGRTNHFLVCTVTGIAPFVSYIRTLHKDWKDGKFGGEQKLFLLNGASRWREKDKDGERLFDFVETVLDLCRDEDDAGRTDFLVFTPNSHARPAADHTIDLVLLVRALRIGAPSWQHVETRAEGRNAQKLQIAFAREQSLLLNFRELKEPTTLPVHRYFNS